MTQKTALQRIREAWKNNELPFSGPVEVETYLGGKEKNKHSKKKLRAGRGPVGKAAIVGAKDRKTNKIKAAVVKATDAKTLQSFVVATALAGATVYTDDAAAYKGMPFEHESVRHSVGEYVDGMAHTNGIESFWATLKRAHKGVYHKMSHKHLQRYVNEFSGRHGIRNVIRWTKCKRLFPGSDAVYDADRRQRAAKWGARVSEQASSLKMDLARARLRAKVKPLAS